MSVAYHFQGRGHNPQTDSSRPLVVPAEAETVFWVVGHGQPRTNIAFCRMVIFDTWGIYLANPFRRRDDFYNRYCWAEYLARDFFIYHEVHIYTVPEEGWMLREE